MSVDTVTIDGRVVGDGRVFVIAELSANHGGSIAKAKETIHAAADAGADAVKLQTYRPESITLESDQAVFRVGDGNLWSGRTLFDLYREAMTPWEWHAELFAEARNLGLSIFSSPFDFDAVDFLEELDAPAYKIASFEILDHALIAKAAATGKPLVISTGMATAEEIDEAVSVARSNGSGGLVLLHCNSTYPAEPGQMDLATIADMREVVVSGGPVGSHAQPLQLDRCGCTRCRRTGEAHHDASIRRRARWRVLVGTQRVRRARRLGSRDRAGHRPRAVRAIAIRGRVVGVPPFVVRRRRRRGRRASLPGQCSIDPSRGWSPSEIHRAGSRTACGGRCGTWHPTRLVDDRGR